MAYVAQARPILTRECLKMRWLLYALMAVWFLGMVLAIIRFWYFQIQLLNNLAPGRTLWEIQGRGFFDPGRFNPRGQQFQRQIIRLWLKTVAWGVGGWLLLGIVGPHLT